MLQHWPGLPAPVETMTANWWIPHAVNWADRHDLHWHLYGPGQHLSLCEALCIAIESAGHFGANTTSHFALSQSTSAESEIRENKLYKNFFSSAIYLLSLQQNCADWDNSLWMKVIELKNPNTVCPRYNAPCNSRFQIHVASLGHIFFGCKGVNSSAKSSNHILLTTVPWYREYSQCQNLQNSTLCSSIVATYAYSFTISIAGSLSSMATLNVKKKVKKCSFLYSAVSSPLNRSKCFTLFAFPDRPVHSDTVLGFSGKHSSHAAITRND